MTAIGLCPQCGADTIIRDNNGTYVGHCTDCGDFSAKEATFGENDTGIKLNSDFDERLVEPGKPWTNFPLSSSEGAVVVAPDLETQKEIWRAIDAEIAMAVSKSIDEERLSDERNAPANLTDTSETSDDDQPAECKIDDVE